MKKEKIIFIISLVMMLLATSISVYATSCLYNSSDVSYSPPSGSGLSANVQDSLTEVYGHCTDYTSMDTRVNTLENIVQPHKIEFNPPNTVTHGGYIDFHYQGSSSDFTSRIIENDSGIIDIQAPNGVKINGQKTIKVTHAQSDNITMTAGQHSLYDIPISLPTGSTLKYAVVLNTPNSAWIFSHIVSYDNTKVRVGAYNTYSGDITGKFGVLLIYE